MKLLMITRKVDRDDSLAGFTYGWIEHFSRAVDKLYVICLEKGSTEGLPKNCEIYSLGKELGKNRFREFMRFQQYAALLVPQVDGVFSHQNPEYGILIAPWCKLYHRKLIAWYTHKAVTLRLRLLTMLADAMVTASAESFRLKSAKLKVLHHGIDADFFSYQERPRSNERVLLSVSRISPTKNIHLMIDVLDALKKSGMKDLQLHIAGRATSAKEKEYECSLQERVVSLDLKKEVSFLGGVAYEQIPPLYHTAVLFLNFSDTGSLDKAVLEAMCSGVPILTTNEAFKEVVERIEPHYFAKKDLAILTGQAQWILNNGPETTCKLSRSHIVENHSLPHLVKLIVEEYGAQ